MRREGLLCLPKALQDAFHHTFAGLLWKVPFTTSTNPYYWLCQPFSFQSAASAGLAHSLDAVETHIGDARRPATLVCRLSLRRTPLH